MSRSQWTVPSIIALSMGATAAALAVTTLWHRRRCRRREEHSTSTDFDDPATVLRMCIRRMEKVRPPRQSQFRVYAILTWMHSKTGTTGWVSGTNSESAYIGGSLCAERSAAVQLRELPADTRVTGIYLFLILKSLHYTWCFVANIYTLCSPRHTRLPGQQRSCSYKLLSLYPCSVYEGSY